MSKGKLIGPHKEISVPVEDKDIERLVEDAQIMYNICYAPLGEYEGFLAIAHPQITQRDPLRFFVTKDNEIIINPIITLHTKTTIDSVEGCATFADREAVTVQRYNKCEVEFQTISKDKKLSEVFKESIGGLRAKIFQHELDHLDGVYIY